MENERKELLNNIAFAWEHTDRYHVNKLPNFERIENIKLKQKLRISTLGYVKNMKRLISWKEKLDSLENNALINDANCLISIKRIDGNVETTNKEKKQNSG